MLAIPIREIGYHYNGRNIIILSFTVQEPKYKGSYLAGVKTFIFRHESDRKWQNNLDIITFFPYWLDPNNLDLSATGVYESLSHYQPLQAVVPNAAFLRHQLAEVIQAYNDFEFADGRLMPVP